MDSKQLDELLQKYWNAETSLEEEQLLKEFFAREPVPEALRETASLFRYFERQKNVSMNDAHFDRELRKKIRPNQTPNGTIRLFPFGSLGVAQLARIAAGLFVVVAATFFIHQEVKKAYPDEPEDTYTDPKVAFEETKKALMMISNSFNKAQKEASKINVFNEAQDKIKKGQDEKKTNI